MMSAPREPLRFKQSTPPGISVSRLLASCAWLSARKHADEQAWRRLRRRPGLLQSLMQTKCGESMLCKTMKLHRLSWPWARDAKFADAIRNMGVRGAPAIGVAAAMGIALGVKSSKAETVGELKPEFDRICEVMGDTRPTAVNLFWAIRRMREKFELLRVRPLPQLKQALIDEARRRHAEDIAANQAMGRHGATLMT